MNPWARFATVMVSAAAIGVAWVAVDATLLVDEEAAITIATPEPTAPTAEPMPQGEEFITTWTGLRVQLPLIPNGEYDFFVDWDADGNADANITEWDSPAAQRVFDTDGPHTVTIVGEIIPVFFILLLPQIFLLEHFLDGLNAVLFSQNLELYNIFNLRKLFLNIILVN